MQRVHQCLFAVSLVALCWLGMMAVHEFGHVLGAIFTGGSVERVILHPLAISRTDVSPNPHPGVVVWLGPVIGCLLPLALLTIVTKRPAALRNVAGFFAGFCLIANGAYISVGSFDGVGDCGEMLQTGTPLWVMLAFGVVTVPAGFYMWHRLGSVSDFIHDPSLVTPRMAYLVAGALLVGIASGLALSPR